MKIAQWSDNLKIEKIPWDSDKKKEYKGNAFELIVTVTN